MMKAAEFYEAKLEFETDPADVHEMMGRGESLIVVDARQPQAYAQGHVPGAINLPHRTMSAETTAGLSRDFLYVTYCDGIGCNASTKGALNLSRLGFRVKEMLGGIDWWVRDGFPVATGEEDAVEMKQSLIRCGC
jgi:rhodanese-related sulfurtransferase